MRIGVQNKMRFVHVSFKLVLNQVCHELIKGSVEFQGMSAIYYEDQRRHEII